MMDDFNISNKSLLKGWNIEVPRIIDGAPLQKAIAFYEVANGTTFDKLTDAQQAEVGPLLVRASLGMLFRYGFFDADRHKGNWLIDAIAKKVFPLDFGQLEDFRAAVGSVDPRVVLVEFMRALQAKNIEGIHRQFEAMSKPSHRPVLDERLRSEFAQALAKDGLTNQIVDLLTVATEAGFDVEKRFSFGAMKGLLILYGEKYVSDETSQKF